MTNAVALTGQWDGLRAIPRTLRTPTHRRRLEDGLDRLGTLYEQMRQRADRLAAGMARIDGLRSGMIDQLDALEVDADLEPSLAFSEVAAHESQLRSLRATPIGGAEWTDLEDACEDEGADADREPDTDDEASLCGVYFGAPVQPMGLVGWDAEDQCDDEGHDSDSEPEEHD